MLAGVLADPGADARKVPHLLRACELMLAAGRAPKPACGSAPCADLVTRCEAEGLREQLVPLHALCARLLAREGDADSAAVSVVRAEQALQQGEIGAVTPIAGLWLAQALQWLDRPADAARQAQRAAAWLTERAEQSVPAEFRDSFLHRNPVHVALMSWST